MEINVQIMPGSEQLILRLRELYYSRGYRLYRMSKFEEYDFYAQNKDFLVSDHVITFTDTDGKLMALKPDVTLSIVKNSRDLPNGLQKVFYVENVYRESQNASGFREIMQTGLECIGNITDAELLEVLGLAGESLKLLSSHSVLEISDLRLLEQVVTPLGLTAREEAALYRAIGEKNQSVMEDIVTDPEPQALLRSILRLHEPPAQAAQALRSMLPETAERESFCGLLEQLDQSTEGPDIRVDFSAMDDIHYYSGVVFKGFISGIPEAVLSGGRYDRLMRRMKRKSGAIGFAVYTDLLERLDGEPAPERDYLNIALPKGRLGEKVYALFAKAGYECPSILEQNRKLVFENPEKKVRYFWVKPSDVAIYVERGAADLGVAGKDILLEYAPDLYELLDLHMGKCRMAVAAPRGFRDDPSRTLRVATKFSAIAKRYYQSQGRAVDMIHLNGSIELAPILGLSDVIVDIVETGSTLRENNLTVIDTVVPISARLVANKSAYKFKKQQMDEIAGSMARIVEEQV